jgi:hypothetical protein
MRALSLTRFPAFHTTQMPLLLCCQSIARRAFLPSRMSTFLYMQWNLAFCACWLEFLFFFLRKGGIWLEVLKFSILFYLTINI